MPSETVREKLRRLRESRALALPTGLVRLIESGYWPAMEKSSQHPAVVLGEDAARALSPNDSEIALMPAPFHTIADEVSGGNSFWIHGVSNRTQINYSLATIIADFGHGSDSPIILYYAKLDSPSVMYLRWDGNGTEVCHEWVETHRTFDEFAQAIGIAALE